MEKKNEVVSFNRKGKTERAEYPWMNYNIPSFKEEEATPVETSLLEAQ